MRQKPYRYLDVLRSWAEEVRPRTILEWGPGASTRTLHRAAPGAVIVSIEHNAEYAQSARRECREYARIIHEPLAQGPSLYAVWPLFQSPREEYDLVFIDGRRRVECLLVAREVLSPNGVVLLHDAWRRQYQVGIALFRKVEYKEQTIVLKRLEP